MRAVLLTMFAFAAAASCTEDSQNLLGERLRDGGSDGDGGETERRDGSVRDQGGEDGPTELCCVDYFCAGCRGQQYPAGDCGPAFCGPNPPRRECPLPTEAACPDCSTLSESECVLGNYGIPGCEKLICNGTFAGCFPNDTKPGCNMDCGVWNTEESCNSAADCHAVYQNSDRCDCNEPGCCLEFVVCSEGPATCSPPAGCPSPMEACGPDHVSSYALPECFEGCVQPEDCAP